MPRGPSVGDAMAGRPHMDRATLARAAHENFVGAFAHVARRLPGGSTLTEGGVVATISGVALPLFNQVVVATDDATAEALAAAVERVGGAGVPWVVALREGADDLFVPVLERLGLRLTEGERLPAMALHPLVEPSSPPPDRDAA